MFLSGFKILLLDTATTILDAKLKYLKRVNLRIHIKNVFVAISALVG